MSTLASGRRKALRFDEFLALYGDDWVGFIEDTFGEWLKDKGGLQGWQKEFLTAVQRGERRIAVRAGHGVAKTTTCVFACICHIVFRYPQKTVVTSPTAPQLFDALYADLLMWISRLPPVLKALLEPYTDRVELKGAPESSFISARTSSKDKPQAMAGVHAEHVLLIADEASDIPDEVFSAASGSMSGENATTVLIGNPRRISGLFFRAFHELSEFWKRFHVSCVGNPLVAPDYIEQQRRSLSENEFRYRVLGDFPTQEADTLIALDLVESAMGRDIAEVATEPLVYGVDVARRGKDRTAVCKRRGNVVLELISWHKDDLMPTVGRIIAEARKDKPAEIMVDTIGVGGGVADRLRELAREDKTLGFSVRDVNVAESEALDPRLSRLRDGLWWQVKEWLEKRACRLPKDEALKADLTAPTYDYLSNGKIKVESKDEMRSRGLRSPDLADALCMTFAGMGAIVGGRGHSWAKGRPLHRGVSAA